MKRRRSESGAAVKDKRLRCMGGNATVAERRDNSCAADAVPQTGARTRLMSRIVEVCGMPYDVVRLVLAYGFVEWQLLVRDVARSRGFLLCDFYQGSDPMGSAFPVPYDVCKNNFLVRDRYSFAHANHFILFRENGRTRMSPYFPPSLRLFDLAPRVTPPETMYLRQTFLQIRNSDPYLVFAKHCRSRIVINHHSQTVSVHPILHGPRKMRCFFYRTRCRTTNIEDFSCSFSICRVRNRSLRAGIHYQ
jgi:hypothetical protein